MEKFFPFRFLKVVKTNPVHTDPQKTTTNAVFARLVVGDVSYEYVYILYR